MQRHLHAKHDWQSPQKKGRHSMAAKLAETAYTNVVTAPIHCQTFYQQSQFVRFFQVTPLSPGVPAVGRALKAQSATVVAAEAPIDLWKQQTMQQLDREFAAADEQAKTKGLDVRQYTQSDPWLNKTLWEHYLRGQNLAMAARLIDLPLLQPGEDCCLDLLLASFDRLIEQVRLSIRQREVNVFDLHRVNNFVSSHSAVAVVFSKQQKRAMMRPLLSALQEDTYKRYKQVWKQLLCFVYRRVYRGQQPALHYALTGAQKEALQRLIDAAEAVSSSAGPASSPLLGVAEQRQAALDQACLRFCITLLDHRLNGLVDDSVLVGFVAVRGIDPKKNGFYESTSSTPYLSALVKMAQLLVLRQAIAASEAGECEYPAEALDEMQERFMVYGTRSPMNWIQKLRTYGKKITDTTTGLGRIVWSDDGEELSYKGLECEG